MPSPNALKEYAKDAYYHIYNRGINHMDLYKNPKDYQVFIDYLRLSLTPTRNLKKELNEFLTSGGSSFRTKQLNNAIQKGMKYGIYKNLDLMAYCLMPNHFHLILYQKIKNGIEILMRRIASGYSQYFNKKYKRRGSLFEGRYKAAHLHYEPELQTLFTARYVERNPLELLNMQSKDLNEYPYSSFSYHGNNTRDYDEKPIWLKVKRIENIFQKIKERPNSIIEEEVAKKGDYHAFVTNDINFEIEDIRLYNIS